jgi:hypothetical protein
MASYPKPTNIEPINVFNPAYFSLDDVPLTPAEADKRYLRFPTAQGTENLKTINVSGVATFSNNVNIGSAGTTNNTPVLTTNKTEINIGTGGSGSVNVECPLNLGGFSSLNLLNADITMNDDSYINQIGTHTTPNALYSINMNTGTRIQYPDATQQNSAYTGAGILAGSYTNTNMTVDSNGKITALTNGASASGDADNLYLTNTTGCIDMPVIATTQWERTPNFTPNSIRTLHTNATGQYILLPANATGCYFSIDYGATFILFASTFASERSRGSGFSASGRYSVIQTGNGVAGNLYHSTNYGLNYSNILFTGTSGADTCIDTTCIDSESQNIYTMNLTTGGSLTLFRVIYNYSTYTSVLTTNFAGDTNFSNVVGLRCSADGRYLIFNGTSGGVARIYHSSNYGATWVRTSPTTNYVIGSGASTVGMSQTGQIMFAVMQYIATSTTSILVSYNYGLTWTKMFDYFISFNAGFILDRVACNGDASVIIATGEDTAGNTYFCSTNDYGSYWYLSTGVNSGKRFCAISNNGSLIYSFIPTPTLAFVSTSIPLKVSNSTITQSVYNFVACPSYFEDFTGGTNNGTMGSTLLYRFSGGGGSEVYEGVLPLNANIELGANGRIGMVDMTTTAVANDACLYATEETFRLANIKSITYGFNLCGNEAPDAVANGVDFGNGYQYMGITSLAPTDEGNMGGTTILFRYSAPTGATSNWTLVENNVVKETFTGTNLTGGMSNKWHRCTLYFLNGGTQYYGIWYNLTNQVQYQTAVYTISGTSSINTNVASCIGISTLNTTDKHILWDYVLIEPNTYPIGGISQTVNR